MFVFHLILDGILIRCLFFRPYKESWRNIIYKFKMINRNVKNTPKSEFPTLLKECLSNMNLDKKKPTLIEKNLVSDIKAKGIMPFNPHNDLRKLPDY